MVGRLYIVLACVAGVSLYAVVREILHTEQQAHDAQATIVEEVRQQTRQYVRRSLSQRLAQKENKKDLAPGTDERPPAASQLETPEAETVLIVGRESEGLPPAQVYDPYSTRPLTQEEMDDMTLRLESIYNLPNKEFQLKTLQVFRKELLHAVTVDGSNEFYASVLEEVSSLERQLQRSSRPRSRKK